MSYFKPINKHPNLDDVSFSPISVAIDYYFNDWITSWVQPANKSVIEKIIDEIII